MEEQTEKDITRRGLLKKAGAVGSTTTVSGCAYIFGPDAPELRNQAERTESNIRQEVPWGQYALNFDTGSLDLDLERIGPTGVQDAYQYQLEIEIDLARDSNDLFGWMGTEERRREFFSLYAEPTYDILRVTYDNFQELTPPRRPSHRNQVAEYEMQVNGRLCSYVQDTIPGERMDEILASRSSYENYLSDGDEAEIALEEGWPFGWGWIC